MDQRAAVGATIRGTVLQVIMVLLGKFVPALGTTPNFYAIAGTVLAALTGGMAGRLLPGAPALQAAGTGAVAGGVSSALGGLAAVVMGQWPGFQAVQLLFPLLSGGVAGGLGGLVGRLVGKPAA